MNTVVQIKSAWLSKINWTQVAAASVALAVAFGLPVTDEVRANILTAVPIVQGLVTWVFRTWFNGTVSPASL